MRRWKKEAATLRTERDAYKSRIRHIGPDIECGVKVKQAPVDYGIDPGLNQAIRAFAAALETQGYEIEYEFSRTEGGEGRIYRDGPA